MYEWLKKLYPPDTQVSMEIMKNVSMSSPALCETNERGMGIDLL